MMKALTIKQPWVHAIPFCAKARTSRIVAGSVIIEVDQYMALVKALDRLCAAEPAVTDA